MYKKIDYLISWFSYKKHTSFFKIMELYNLPEFMSHRIPLEAVATEIIIRFKDER